MQVLQYQCYSLFSANPFYLNKTMEVYDGIEQSIKTWNKFLLTKCKQEDVIQSYLSMPLLLPRFWSLHAACHKYS